jgi:hypothetical protein
MKDQVTFPVSTRYSLLERPLADDIAEDTWMLFKNVVCRMSVKVIQNLHIN